MSRHLNITWSTEVKLCTSDCLIYSEQCIQRWRRQCQNSASISLRWMKSVNQCKSGAKIIHDFWLQFHLYQVVLCRTFLCKPSTDFKGRKKLNLNHENQDFEKLNISLYLSGFGGISENEKSFANSVIDLCCMLISLSQALSSCLMQHRIY